MQLDYVTKRQYKSTMHCLQSVWRTYGSRALYVGMVINVMRETLFNSTYFAVYEGVKGTLMQGKSRHELPAWVVILSGAACGATAWFVCFPTDVMYSNLQKATIMNNETDLTMGRKQLNTVTYTQVLQQLLKQKGWSVFYQGLGTSVARSCIVAPSRFIAYEFTLKFLEERMNKQ